MFKDTASEVCLQINGIFANEQKEQLDATPNFIPHVFLALNPL